MIAKKCDRCGNYYEPYGTKCNEKEANGFMLLNIDERQKYFLHKPIDLCLSCMADLYAFIQNKKEGAK